MSLRKRVFPAKAYFYYWLHAVDEHSLHSPFLFHFFAEVVKNDIRLPAFQAIERRRAVLLQDNRIIASADPGAGSLVSKAGTRTVKHIARHSLSPPPFCRLLFRAVQYVKPVHMLEIGSSFGISSSYIFMGAPDASFTTIEGSEDIAGVARETFDELGNARGIQLVAGRAEEHLASYITAIPQLDFAYIDAHHTEAATISYFEAVLQKIHQKSVLVVGDIHWSYGMEKAWRHLAGHPTVSLSLDLFQAGVLFFDPGLRKETVILKA